VLKDHCITACRRRGG